MSLNLGTTLGPRVPNVLVGDTHAQTCVLPGVHVPAPVCTADVSTHDEHRTHVCELTALEARPFSEKGLRWVSASHALNIPFSWG